MENINSKTFGYCRVSSTDQKEDRQLEAMLELGINERDIFVDKCSGKNFDRPQYQALKVQLREGDVLVIKSIDRLGRNYKQICEEWREITREIKANIKVLDMPVLDTTRTEGLIGEVISDIVLQLLSYVAEQERAFIKQRQAEGIKLAKDMQTNGVVISKSDVLSGSCSNCTFSFFGFCSWSIIFYINFCLSSNLNTDCFKHTCNTIKSFVIKAFEIFCRYFI